MKQALSGHSFLRKLSDKALKRLRSARRIYLTSGLASKEAIKALEVFSNEISLAPEPPVGILDGITILRYAHVERERASGGVEQYLRHLHHGLLQKHRMTILQMHLAKDSADQTTEVEQVGIGRIVWMPVQQVGWPISGIARRLRYILEEARSEASNGGGWAGASKLFHEYGRHLQHRTSVLSNHLAKVLTDYQVNLLVMHWLNYDSDALLTRALESGIPYVLINHFDNAHLALPRNRQWVARATAIGTVSSRGIPVELKNSCTALSDAVDTDFFAPEKATQTAATDHPVILMPARIDIGKGHEDLLEVARILIARGVKFSIRFVGVVECEPLHKKLRQRIVDLGLQGHVEFLGERSAEEIRDLYASCCVVALPSHSEGLGRVLLEAQAMKKPVVAYNCGGTGEALIPNETGILVERGDLAAFANGTTLFLESESQRLSHGERGRAFVSARFSIPALVKRHEIFYLKALAAAPTRVTA